MGLLLSLVSLTANASTTHCLVPSKSKGVAATLVPCDFTFTATPTFSCSATPPQSGVYTIRNNTPVTMRINYIRIKANDAQPAAASSIDTTVANSCGTSLASGATCNIKVNLQPLVALNLSRILQIGIDSRQIELDGLVAIPNVTACFPAGFPPGISPETITAFNEFSIFGSSTVTNTGSTVITGDLGLTPGSAVTGFGPGIVTGTIHINDANTAAARLAILAVYNSLWTQVCPFPDLPVAIGANTTLAPGVHCAAALSVTIGNNVVITLDGQGNPLSTFTLQIPVSLTANNNVTINLINGAQRSNVFWIVGVVSLSINLKIAVEFSTAIFFTL